ncbi:methyltransferase domain-containing protein [Nocardioides marmorisolisilvae]|uniref:Methyltransferase domain-containing protein n=1 Tax=Nocardioides marmorisolisilvae TaxID=1542737 RepID=A0A3N0DS27_9ACTN|nr:methyltransferase domain-containing protein [Nocardioides marmorisolisilvae]RNL78321.1 methyltransferase domain-containing protein [Nocardioides marmorisolisilvae]
MNSTHTWDPDRYLVYADERGRPFLELIARIDAAEPSVVVDLGCGPGNLTVLLADRWSRARVTGIDTSPAMIERARDDHGARIGFELGDVRTWAPTEPVDVLVSNATLQWVPGHLELLPSLVAKVRHGGWFAFQVPGNLSERTHTIRAELAAQEPYAALTAGVDAPAAFDYATYWRALTDLGCEVDAWSTTYLHELRGEDPVFGWISGTGARPVLEALDAEPELRASYEAELKRRLREAYPEEDGRVLMPFRGEFVVARVGEEESGRWLHRSGARA